MTQHRVSRRVDVGAEEVIEEYRGGYDTDIYITSVDGGGEWVCSCGAGPFKSKKGGKKHLSNV